VVNSKLNQLNSNTFFSSKTNTLNFLQKKLKFSLIEPIYDFTISNWIENKSKILKDIEIKFDKYVIIRSSAIGEDSPESSQAGSFSSFLNIPANSNKKLESAINSVIQSYSDKGNIDNQNQILVQKQTEDIICSGVVFSRSLDLGSPYYIINYEEGTSTTGVTQGLINNSIRIHRNIDSIQLLKKWRFLLKSIREIEILLQNTKLDIEFGIKTDYTIVIFQVRPLTSLKSKTILDNSITKVIIQNKKKFLNLQISKNLLGSHTIFSDMSDWNPAEIIGDNPNLLDYSLYNYLIMTDAWHKGRKTLGYQKLNNSLMVKFGNKPYVDLRASLNSLLPENIPLKLRKKLIYFYLNQIKENPSLHDKIEFDILFTCYDFEIKHRLKLLKKSGFTDIEILKLNSCLISFTNNIIDQFPQILDNTKKSIETLTVQRKNIESQLSDRSLKSKQLIKMASQLLKDCIKFGTIPFSTIARVGFIGSILLKSIITFSKLNPSTYDKFLNSISTPLSEIQQDLLDYSTGKFSKSLFLDKYGHLRPGTYDITALRYDMNNTFFEDIKFHKPKSSSSNSIINNTKLLQKIKKSPLNFDSVDFFSFVKNSLEQREFLKFEFTKNLSLSLEIIARAASQLGFSRTDLTFLEITDILKLLDFDNEKLIRYWNQKIIKNKKTHNLNNMLILPPLIISKHDFEYIQFFKPKPNFVTSKKIKSDIINFKSLDVENISIDRKIILIENADPGYDWIFTKNPSGLITKYGGVASHMAIRCAELDIPAAIGCGEILFEKLQTSSKISLDCNNKEILILENRKIDDEIEVRKILKSLGYIK
jgi:glutamine kinase